MTEAQARTAANLVIGTAAVGTMYVILRTPPLRRVAWQLTRRWVTGPLLVWTATELRRAWDVSGASRRGPAGTH
jgi:hypothetical protein